MLYQVEQVSHKSETKLMIACSQTNMLEAEIELVSGILKEDLNWDFIYKIGDRNAILPLICINLLKKFSRSLNPESKKILSLILSRQTRTNMLLMRRLVEIIQLFESEKVSIIPFKGPLLAIDAYKNLALRHFVDLDILVKPTQLAKAIELLLTNGFNLVTDSFWINNLKSCIKQKKDISFISEDGLVYIELHWKLSKPYFDIPIGTENLWSKSQTGTFAGQEIKKLPFNYLLIYLCLHGAKHEWHRLSWICDINELIQSTDNIDWEMLDKEAKSLGCERVLYLGLYLVHYFFKLNSPIISKIQASHINKLFQQISKDTHKRLFSEETTNFELATNHAFQLKLKERFQDKLKLHKYYASRYIHVLISANDVDRNLFKLPGWLNPLYYILRPFRLFFNYMVNSKRNKKSSLH